MISKIILLAKSTFTRIVAIDNRYSYFNRVKDKSFNIIIVDNNHMVTVNKDNFGIIMAATIITMKCTSIVVASVIILGIIITKLQVLLVHLIIILIHFLHYPPLPHLHHYNLNLVD